MSKEKMNRRDFIKGGAVAAIGGLLSEKIGVDKKISSPDDEITGDEVKKILSDPRVVEIFGEPKDIYIKYERVSNKETLKALLNAALDQILILKKELKEKSELERRIEARVERRTRLYEAGLPNGSQGIDLNEIGAVIAGPNGFAVRAKEGWRHFSSNGYYKGQTTLAIHYNPEQKTFPFATYDEGRSLFYPTESRKAKSLIDGIQVNKADWERSRKVE